MAFKGFFGKALRALLDNWVIKLFSLVVAIVIFLVARRQVSESGEFVAAVEVKTPAVEGITVASVDPSELRITVKGTKEQIQQTRNSNKIVLRLPSPATVTPDTEEEIITLKGNRGIISSKLFDGLEGSARVTDILPAEVTVTYGREAEMSLPVAAPEIIGKTLLGKSQIVWTDTNVVVRGPEHKLQGLKDNAVKLATEPIDVDGRMQNFTKKVRVLLPPDAGNLEIISSPFIEVRVVVDLEIESRIYDGVPVQLTTVSGNGMVFSCEPSVVSVKITGPKEKLRTLQTNDVIAIADCRDMSRRRLEKEANVVVHPYLQRNMDGLSIEATPGMVDVSAKTFYDPGPTNALPAPTVHTKAVAPIEDVPDAAAGSPAEAVANGAGGSGVAHAANAADESLAGDAEDSGAASKPRAAAGGGDSAKQPE